METKSTREEELLRLSLFLLKVVEASHEALMFFFTEDEQALEESLHEQIMFKVREYLKGDYHEYEKEAPRGRKGKGAKLKLKPPKRFTH